MPAAVDSTFDVVNWFLDKALDEGEYLQPQKLHRLMYLAQAYYAVANYGRKLMPAVFVADDMGPVEPTVFRVFEIARPAVEPRQIPDNVGHFLDGVWRRFGSHSADHLTRVVKSHPPYAEAYARGARAEIPLEAMHAFYGAVGAARRGAPAVQDVLRPRVLKSHTGRPVSVTRWMPPVKAQPKD